MSEKEARTIEVQALLDSTRLSRLHGALQSSLSTATFLSQLVEPCRSLGLKIEAAVKFESSNVLWDQGEMAASVRILQDIIQSSDLVSQDVTVGRPELLAKLVR